MKKIALILSLIVCLAGCSSPTSDLNSDNESDAIFSPEDEKALAELINESEPTQQLKLYSQDSIIEDERETDIFGILLNDPNMSDKDKESLYKIIEDNQKATEADEIARANATQDNDNSNHTHETIDAPTIQEGGSSKEPQEDNLETVETTKDKNEVDTPNDVIEKESNNKEITLPQLIQEYNSIVGTNITLEDSSVDEITLISDDASKIYITRYQLLQFLYKRAINDKLIDTNSIAESIEYSDSSSIPDRYGTGLMGLKTLGLIETTEALNGNNYITKQEMQDLFTRYKSLAS